MSTDDVEMNPKPIPTGADTPPGTGRPIDEPPPPPAAGVVDRPPGGTESDATE